MEPVQSDDQNDRIAVVDDLDCVVALHGYDDMNLVHAADPPPTRGYVPGVPTAAR